MKEAEPAGGRASEIAKRSAREREDVAQARRAWWTDPDALGGVSPERLVFSAKPEVCAGTTLSRLQGRSPRGTRACASAPRGHWTRLTVLGALGAEGIVGAMSVETATSSAVRACLDQVLLPELRRTNPMRCS